MNNEERAMLERISEYLRRINETLRLQHPLIPPPLFQDTCEKCKTITTHFSDIVWMTILYKGFGVIGTLDSTEAVIKTCLSCGVKTYLHD